MNYKEGKGIENENHKKIDISSWIGNNTLFYYNDGISQYVSCF